MPQSAASSFSSVLSKVTLLPSWDVSRCNTRGVSMCSWGVSICGWGVSICGWDVSRRGVWIFSGGTWGVSMCSWGVSICGWGVSGVAVFSKDSCDILAVAHSWICKTGTEGLVSPELAPFTSSEIVLDLLVLFFFSFWLSLDSRRWGWYLVIKERCSLSFSLISSLGKELVD